MLEGCGGCECRGGQPAVGDKAVWFSKVGGVVVDGVEVREDLLTGRDVATEEG